MNNLLCSALLISVVLILTDAVIIPDCKNGGTLVEENGKFKCNCPLNTFGDDCNCRYKYSNVKSLTPRAYAERTVSDSAKCDENCANDTKCSTSTTWLGTCLRYKTPIIFVSLDGKEDQCIEKCNEMSECKTICTQNHTRNFSCYLFNVTLDKIPDNMKRPYKANYKIRIRTEENPASGALIPISK
ncbi:hypothetical protein LOTGIDRAFT_176445 [Lottia gigantea]|uniref:EGF-like domain-containing protein n=1 Tax=Lottia gigantea TaxID=225164 RepID=V4B636_LOTGI|nr:hypothetical protein LOTGIDRAFT_176445 [Lottia gigantea]ESP01552.1 hypothetical protein LOTGIDRAFT_176445 [Lottia gigantea]